MNELPERADGWERVTVFAVGHSTCPVSALVDLLSSHGIRCLVDIRSVPRSRTAPQFNKDALFATLQNAGIGYEHVPELGGWRRSLPGSPNNAWRNASFRGFADYMQTSGFSHGLELLRSRALSSGPVAIMCAEAWQWRCHRNLVADALFARGVQVRHLLLDRPDSVQLHQPPSFAKIQGTQVAYPGSKS